MFVTEGRPSCYSDQPANENRPKIFSINAVRMEEKQCCQTASDQGARFHSFAIARGLGPEKKRKKNPQKERKQGLLVGNRNGDARQKDIEAGDTAAIAQASFVRTRHNLDLPNGLALARGILRCSHNKKAERLGRSADLPIFGPAIFARPFRVVAEFLKICIRTPIANISKIIEMERASTLKLRQSVI